MSYKEIFAFTVFERAFKHFGLPLAIRTDNGRPFASNSASFGLSKRSSASSQVTRSRTGVMSACI